MAVTTLLLLNSIGTALGADSLFPPAESRRPLKGDPFPKLESELLKSARRNTILVIPKKEHAEKEDQVNNLHRKLNTKVKAKFPTIRGLQVVETPPGSNLQDMISEFLHSGLVDLAEPDFALRIRSTPNDPLFPYDAARRLEWSQNEWTTFYTSDAYQWTLNNSGQAITRYDTNGVPVASTGPNTAGADVRAANAWSIQNSAPNQIVAVIDTGVRHTHEDLIANRWTNPNEIPDNGVDDDGNEYVDDVYGINPGGTNALDKVNVLPNPDFPRDGHGTFVAGVIGAKGNNATGISGIAWETKIMSLKVAHRSTFLDDLEAFTSDVVACLNYAVQKQAKVVNISLGADYQSPALKAAFEAARGAGVICVTAAGNVPKDVDRSPEWPACLDLENMVNVGLSGPRDQVTELGISNFGAATVSLVAPGYFVVSTYHRTDSDYRWDHGTSFSSPLVAGAVALLKEHFPADTYLQTINRLLASADRLPETNIFSKTGSRLNLNNALMTSSARPANDDFDKAFFFSPNPLPTTVSVANNIGAGAESNEPAHAGQSATKSVWWTWTPSSDFLPVSPKKVTVTSKGSAIPTVLAVYTGSSVSTLTQVDSSQDGAVVINAQAGTTYRIAVDGLGGTSGVIRFAAINDPSYSDFNRDTQQDIIFQDSAGYLGVWFTYIFTRFAGGYLSPSHPGQGWRVFASGDFNRDGKADLAFQHDDGTSAVWHMDGINLTSAALFSPSNPGDPNWRAISLADINRDGNLDILYQHTDGTLAVWYLVGLTLQSGALLNPSNPGSGWRVVGTGDFSSSQDDKVDLLFQHDDGSLAVWYMDGVNYAGSAYLNPSNPGDPLWRVRSAADMDKDGKPDILFQHSGSGDVGIWKMNGIAMVWPHALEPANPGGSWQIVAP